MQLIRSKTAYYPSFTLGSEPRAIECQISIIEANDKRYLKTPFAMLNAYADDDIERQVDNRVYFDSAEKAVEYLNYEYPNWQAADAIMRALVDARHYAGSPDVGASQVADKCGVSSDSLYGIYALARGHKRFTLKQVQQAVRKLAE